MKSLVRGGLVLTLLLNPLGGLLTDPWPLMAQGIPTANVAERLKQVPVFTLIDSSGKQSLTISVRDKEVSFFFLSPQDAQTALQRLQTQNPALARGAQIRAIGLDKAYELAKSVQQTKDQKFDVSFLPDGVQVDAALKILQASGQKTDKFPGIPLFFITGGPQQAQLTVTLPGEGERAPMFFSREDADAFLAEVKKQDPKVGETAKIQVSSLDRLVAIMEQKNDPQLRQLYFIPSSSALRFIQQQQGNTGDRNPVQATDALTRKQQESPSTCAQVKKNAIQRFDNIPNISVRTETRSFTDKQFVVYPDHPKGRPQKYLFAFLGSGVPSLLNSRKIMESIANDIIKSCDSVGGVAFGVDKTGELYIIGIFPDGTIRWFNCLNNDDPRRAQNPRWGQQYCN
jgi:nickel transport protein